MSMKGKRIAAYICTAALIVTSIQFADGTNAASVYASESSQGTADTLVVTNENYMDDAYYAQLGLPIGTPDLFSAEDTSNPYEGYQTAIIDELYVGTMNHDADYEGTFLIADNTTTPNSDSLYFETFIKNKLASRSYSLDSSGNTQCISAIAVNTSNKLPDGGAIPQQVIVENRIYEYTKGDNDSYQKLRVYTKNASGSLIEGTGDTILLAEDDGWVGAITIREQGGFTSMTTGDYDKDGQSEVAVHVPKGSQAGYIYIYGLVADGDHYKLSKEGEFEVASLGNRFKWSSDRCRPLVNLTTTSMAGRDDIIMNVSLPYDKYSKACDAGVLSVISYNASSKSYKNIMHDCMVIGSEEARFKLQAATPADVNGDGVDELVVAGYMNSGYTNGSSRGNIEDKLVFNILLWNGNSYYWAWSDAKVKEKAVKRNTNIHVDDSGSKESENDPVTITAAKYNQTDTADTIFCEGAFYTFNVGSSGTSANRAIEDGSFAFVKNIGLENTDEAFVGVAATGTFASDSPATEQSYIVTGHNARGDDTCDLYVTAVWGEGSTIKENRVNDYFDNVGEDDNGTTIALCPVNVDDDSCYYKYVGKTTGWCKPEIMCVLMSPPYWRELDYAGDYGTTSLEVSTSHEDNETEDWSLGLFVDGQYLFGAGVGGTGAKFGFDASLAASYVDSYTDAHVEGTSYTFSAMDGANTVGLMAAPQISYNYEIYVPAYVTTQEDVDCGAADKVGVTVAAHTEEMSVIVTLDPVYSQMELEAYNAVAKQYNTTVSEKERQLPVIEIDKLYAAGYDPGDPTTYVVEASQIQSLSDTSDADSTPDSRTSTATAVGITSLPVGISLSESDSEAWNHGLALDGSLSFVGTGEAKFLWLFTAETTWQFGVDAEYGYTWGTVDTDGLVYSATVKGLPASAQTGTAVSGNATSAYDFTTAMVRWYPNVLDRKKDSSTDMKALEEWIPAIGFAVPTLLGNVPAKLPEDLHVAATTANTALVSWTNPVVTGKRPEAKAYRLYVSTQQDGDYTEVGLVTPGTSGTTNYLVDQLKADTTYYFKLETYTDSAGTQNRSVKSAAIKGVTKGVGPTITTAPKDCFIDLTDNNTENDVPLFTIEAAASQGGSLSYQWQKLVVGTYGAEWVDLISNNSADVASATFNPAYYTTEKCVTVDNKNAFDKTLYRCVVTETLPGYETAKTYSRAVGLYVDQKEIDVAISSVSDGIVSNENGELEVLSGSDVTTTITVTHQDGTPYNGYNLYFFARKDGQPLSDVAKKGILLTTDAEGKIEYTFKDLKAGTYQVMVGSKSQDAALTNGTNLEDGSERVVYQGYHSDLITVNVADGCLISYNLNGGVNDSDNPSFVTTATGTIALKDATKTDYTFLGWYMTNPDGSRTKLTEIDPTVQQGNITLTAEWEAITYEIDYMLNGGTNNAANPTIYTVGDSAFIRKPAKKGYLFEGWYLDSDFKTRVYGVSNLNGDVTLYAKWSEAVENRIHYMLVDGTNHKDNPESFTVESKTITLKTPIRNGYLFEGWYADSEYTIPVTDVPAGTAEDVYLYAKWKLNMTSPNTGDVK